MPASKKKRPNKQHDLRGATLKRMKKDLDQRSRDLKLSFETREALRQFSAVFKTEIKRVSTMR